MKNAFLLIMTFMAQSAFAQIKFEQAVTNSPLVAQVVYGSCGPSSCYYTDAAGKVRLKLNLSYDPSANGNYTLLNSVGEVISTVEASAEIIKQTGRALNGISASCVGKIFIDRNSVKIFDVNSCNNAHLATLTMVSKYVYGNTILLRAANEYSNSLTYDINKKTYRINYFGSGTAIQSERTLSATEAAKFEGYIKSTRLTCPLSIDYNPLSSEILKVKIGCDPLAAIDNGQRNG